MAVTEEKKEEKRGQFIFRRGARRPVEIKEAVAFPEPPALLTPELAKSFENVFESVVAEKPLTEIVISVMEIINMMLVDETLYSVTTNNSQDALLTYLFVLKNVKTTYINLAAQYFSREIEKKAKADVTHFIAALDVLSHAIEQFALVVRGLLTLNKPGSTALALARYGYIRQ